LFCGWIDCMYKFLPARTITTMQLSVKVLWWSLVLLATQSRLSWTNCGLASEH